MTNTGKPTKETLEKWHNDPDNWKWGWAYYNKEDKRIFPPKRHKYLGWTVNFANPMSIITLLLVVFLIVFVSRFFKTH